MSMLFLHMQFDPLCVYKDYVVVFMYCVSVCENHSEAGVCHFFKQARWGQIRIEEATLVPCHHPKTELLQNILKI